MLFRNQHGSGDHEILREDPRRGCGNVTGENREIERARFFQPARGRGEAEAAGERRFRKGVLHYRRSHGVSAMLTEGTSRPPRPSQMTRPAKARVFPRAFVEVEQL